MATRLSFTDDCPRLLGAANEAQALRLALTYALIDGTDRIEIHHLEAGLAMWRYSEESAARQFGGAELDLVAQTIVEALGRGPLSQSPIRDLFGRHEPAARLTSTKSPRAKLWETRLVRLIEAADTVVL